MKKQPMYSRVVREIIYKNDLGDTLEKITLATGQSVYRVISIGIGQCGEFLNVKIYNEIPIDIMRDIKLRKILNE
jgi:hypothetical protein